MTVVHELALPVLDLSMADAASISSAILLVWVVGYAFRILIRALNVDGDSNSSEVNQ
ncbi:MAG: hypothetical protein LT082_12335 [Comamonas sp.]|nr:hypothetical protein [Comamonas sp.]